MQFYQLYTDLDSMRTDGESWCINSLSELGGLDSEHYQGNKIPRQSDIDKLKVKVWSDCPLADVVSKNFYDCFFISNRLRQLLSGLRLPDDHIFFFETIVTWRGKQHPYHWLQSIEPSNEDDWIDFAVSNFKFESEDRPVQLNSLKELHSRIYDERYEKGMELGIEWLKSEVYFNAAFAEFDLFRLPGKDLGRGLFASQRLKDLIEAQGITGLGFLDSPYVKISSLRKTPKPTKQPEAFSLKFYDFDPYVGNGFEQKAPAYATIEAWLQHLFDTTGLDPAHRMSVLNFAKNSTRTAITIHLKKALTDDDLEKYPDMSRHYGRPFVPKSFKWPRTDGGQALVFIAQINLSSLPKNNELPSTGLLQFFVDVYGSSDSWPTAPDKHRVFFYEKTTGFTLADFPNDLPINADFQSDALVFSTKFDLPDDRWTELFTAEEFLERDAYDEFIGKLEMEDIILSSKLLGWPKSYQAYVGLMLSASELLGDDWENEDYVANEQKINKSAMGWRLLFQAEAAQLGLEDQLSNPMLYFLIRNEDLKKGDLAKAVLVMQSD